MPNNVGQGANLNLGDRADWIDYAKGLGIILVVYSHVSRGVINAGVHVPLPELMLLDSVLYTFHMPLFFLLSGLLFQSSFEKRGARSLVFSKIDSIVYPYILWSLLQGFTESILSDFTNGKVKISDVLALLWQPRSQFWFLYTLFLVFALSAVLEKFVCKRYRAIVLLIAVLLYLVGASLGDIRVLEDFSYHFVYFYLGIFLANERHRIESVGVWVLPAVTFVFGLAQWFFHVKAGNTYEDRGVLSLLLAFISIIQICIFSKFLSDRKWALFRLLGISSMAIYLMHILVGAGTRILLSEALGVEHWFITISTCVLVGICLPVFLMKSVEKYRIRYIFSAPLSRWMVSFGAWVRKSVLKPA